MFSHSAVSDLDYYDQFGGDDFDPSEAERLQALEDIENAAFEADDRALAAARRAAEGMKLCELSIDAAERRGAINGREYRRESALETE